MRISWQLGRVDNHGPHNVEPPCGGAQARLNRLAVGSERWSHASPIIPTMDFPLAVGISAVGVQ